MKIKKTFCMVIAALFTLLTMLSYIPAKEVKAAVVVPKIQFATAPITQYKVGERVSFNINAPNYGGRVEYRVVLWEDSKKTYHDLWNESNGYPNRYYTKWQPYGNEIFTLGWIINEPGSYRITVYAKRKGISNAKTYLKGMNCDSYMESVAFRVAANSTVGYIVPSNDVIVNQGQVPSLPTTVKAVMTDGTEKSMRVTWGSVNTGSAGAFTIQGTVDGTDKKAIVRVIVNQVTIPAPSSGLSINSISAVSTTWVNVNLKQSISTIPSSSTFSIKSSNNAVVRIITTSLSTDKKTVQIYTDFMTPGGTYTLLIDGVSYNFIVPNSGSSTGGVSISADDMVVAIDDEVEPDITVYPSNATLRFSSEDEDIAEVDSQTGEITGIAKGTVTIYAYAYSSTYGTASTTFEVKVVEEYSNLPDKDECDADHDYDDYDDTYTITLYIMDEDGDPIENLDEEDFKINLNGKAYYFDTNDEIIYDFDEVDDGEYEFVFDTDELPTNDQEDEYEMNVYINGRIAIEDYELTEDGGSNSDATPYKIYCKAVSDDNEDGTATISVDVFDKNNDPIDKLDDSDFKVKVIDDKTYTVGGTGPFDNLYEYKDGKYEFDYEPSTLPPDGYIKVDIIVKGITIKTGLTVDVSEKNAVVKVSSITVKAPSDTLVLNGTMKMEAEISPSTATNKTVTWSVAPVTGAAWIDTDGILHATKGGTVTVTATAKDGSNKTGSKVITVTIPLIGITIKTAGGVSVVEKDKTLLLSIDTDPVNASNNSVIWSIVSGGATIDSNGLLKANSEGPVKVRAVSVEKPEITDEIDITIIPAKVLVTGIVINELDNGRTTLKVNETVTMTAEIFPTNATVKGVLWFVTLGSGIASINTLTGELSAQSAGTITVKAQAKDDPEKFDTINLTIIPAE